jgi:hypothetical protein
MRPASNDPDAPQNDDGTAVAVHGESSGEGDPASDRRPEPRVDADDRTPEEAGYGYGV